MEEVEFAWAEALCCAIGARESVPRPEGVVLPYGEEGGERFVLAQQPCGFFC